jgi:hypothetical protein
MNDEHCNRPSSDRQIRSFMSLNGTSFDANHKLVKGMICSHAHLLTYTPFLNQDKACIDVSDNFINTYILTLLFPLDDDAPADMEKPSKKRSRTTGKASAGNACKKCSLALISARNTHLPRLNLRCL